MGRGYVSGRIRVHRLPERDLTKARKGLATHQSQNFPNLAPPKSQLLPLRYLNPFQLVICATNPLVYRVFFRLLVRLSQKFTWVEELLPSSLQRILPDL